MMSHIDKLNKKYFKIFFLNLAIVNIETFSQCVGHYLLNSPFITKNFFY